MISGMGEELPIGCHRRKGSGISPSVRSPPQAPVRKSIATAGLLPVEEFRPRPMLEPVAKHYNHDSARIGRAPKGSISLSHCNPWVCRLTDGYRYRRGERAICGCGRQGILFVLENPTDRTHAFEAPGVLELIVAENLDRMMRSLRVTVAPRETMEVRIRFTQVENDSEALRAESGVTCYRFYCPLHRGDNDPGGTIRVIH